MQLSTLENLSEFCKQPISVAGTLTKKDVEFAVGELLNHLRNVCSDSIVSTSADTEKWLASKAKEERERIAKIFDDMGLRPYAEIVRDSGKEKK